MTPPAAVYRFALVVASASLLVASCGSSDDTPTGRATSTTVTVAGQATSTPTTPTGRATSTRTTPTGQATSTAVSEPAPSGGLTVGADDTNSYEPLTLAVGPVPDRLAPLATVFAKHVDVWGVNIVATAATDDAKVIHAANVMAQYLDNDADGRPESLAVVEAMVDVRATMVMFATELEAASVDPTEVIGFLGDSAQALFATETSPENGFDASLEEIHHLVLNTGWAQVHPDLLGQGRGSEIAAAMDLARGGRYDEVPDEYPSGAWFTYDDRTCDYNCMVTEYTYWAHTGLLGAQIGRGPEIGHEWRLETPEKVRNGDTEATRILQLAQLRLPMVLPDGDYHG